MVNTKLKNVLQNNKRLWHKIGTYKINKTSLEYSDDKIYTKYIS